MLRYVFSIFILTVVGGILANPGTAFASKSDQIDDTTFYDYNSMSEAQIGNWISTKYPSSCLLPQNYPAEYTNNSAWKNVTFKEPLSYFTYGGEVSAARIIWRASQFYSLNPKVILTTLEKESDLISGTKGCSAWRYNSAMGYNCPTGAEEFLKDYPNIGIYRTCVQTESYAGFSPQVNKAAWQLSFDGKRANGDLSWMDDGNVTYYGRMTQGYRARVNGGAQSYYDGYTTINGESVYLSNGPTAALYNYTPFFSRFESIFTDWFGSTHAPSYAWRQTSQLLYTDDTKTTALSDNSIKRNQTFYAQIKVVNTGNATWKKGVASQQVNLGTSRPIDRVSSFYNPDWLNRYGNRAGAMIETTVAPGETGTFEFWMQAPSQTGVYNEYFNLVMDGTSWLQDIGLYWTFTVSNDTADVVNGLSIPGKNYLRRGELLVSPDHKTTFVFQEAGFGELFSKLVSKWTLFPTGGGTNLVLQNDGNLVLYNQANQAIWASNSSSDSSGAMSSLNTNSVLYRGQELKTVDGKYTLAFQKDGNLVIYSPTRAIWASNTKDGLLLAQQGDGNLVMYNKQSKPIWASNTIQGGAKTYLQADGNFVTYTNEGKPIWASNSGGWIP